MQRINTPDHVFHDGDPFNGVQGTAVTAAFLTAIQEELATVVEAAGITLSATANTQLLNALGTLFAGLNSPTLTGTPKAPTPAQNDNSTRLATTAFTQALVAAAVAGINTNLAPTTISRAELYFMGQI